jgi:hypothetical protein
MVAQLGLKLSTPQAAEAKGRQTHIRGQARLPGARVHSPDLGYAPDTGARGGVTRLPRPIKPHQRRRSKAARFPITRGLILTVCCVQRAEP